MQLVLLLSILAPSIGVVWLGPDPAGPPLVAWRKYSVFRSKLLKSLTKTYDSQVRVDKFIKTEPKHIDVSLMGGGGKLKLSVDWDGNSWWSPGKFNAKTLGLQCPSSWELYFDSGWWNTKTTWRSDKNNRIVGFAFSDLKDVAEKLKPCVVKTTKDEEVDNFAAMFQEVDTVLASIQPETAAEDKARAKHQPKPACGPAHHSVDPREEDWYDNHWDWATLEDVHKFVSASHSTLTRETKVDDVGMRLASKAYPDLPHFFLPTKLTHGGWFWNGKVLFSACLTPQCIGTGGTFEASLPLYFENKDVDALQINFHKMMPDASGIGQETMLAAAGLHTWQCGKVDCGSLSEDEWKEIRNTLDDLSKIVNAVKRAKEPKKRTSTLSASVRARRRVFHALRRLWNALKAMAAQNSAPHSDNPPAME